MSKLYDVTLYATVRVKVSGIPAASMKEAIEIAEKNTDLESLLNDNFGGALCDNTFKRIGNATIDYVAADPDATHTALVDVAGDAEYRRSRVWKSGLRGWFLDDYPEDTPTGEPDNQIINATPDEPTAL